MQELFKIYQVDAYEDQSGVIDEWRNDLEPPVAESHALIRRPPCYLARDEGDDQSNDCEYSH